MGKDDQGGGREKKEEEVRQEGDRCLSGRWESVTCWVAGRQLIAKKNKKTEAPVERQQRVATLTWQPAVPGSEGKDQCLQEASSKGMNFLNSLRIIVKQGG